MLTDDATDGLAGEVALVTGASSGIGWAAARSLARNGAAVAVAARRGSRLRDLATAIEDELDATALPVPVDVTEEGQVERMVETTVAELGPPSILVNNAGVLRSMDDGELPSDAYHTMMAVNVNGVYATTRATLAYLRESAGNLVFVGSNAGIYPYPANPIYAGTKWWLRGFAHSMAVRYADEVSVSVINPSTTRTGIGGEDGTPNEERFDPGEKLEPTDVAEAIVYAVERDSPTAVNELNLFRQDELAHL